MANEKRKDILNIKRSKRNSQWNWTLISGSNGKIIASGQSSGFANKANALKGFDSVVRACTNYEVVETGYSPFKFGSNPVPLAAAAASVSKAKASKKVGKKKRHTPC